MNILQSRFTKGERGLKPLRVILRKQPSSFQQDLYSTHVEVLLEKGCTNLLYGHYDMTWEDALNDFILRVRQNFYAPNKR